MDFSSQLLKEAVDKMAQLPGIGRRTALRLVLHLLRRPGEETKQLAAALEKLAQGVNYCKSCHNISDTAVCGMCSNAKRDQNTVCVVEDIRDVMAIEATAQYRGLYHVLGGKISPVDGVGPGDLTIDALIKRVQAQEIKEIIFALSPSMEGDTTNFYIYRLLRPFRVVTSAISRGISVGDELEYADEITLGRSILHRIPFETSIKSG